MQVNSESPTGRVRALDGFRGFLLFIVMIMHFPVPVFMGTYLPGGFFALTSFFTLSGYLIGGILIREWKKYGIFSLKAFYFRRILRLFPPLFLFLLVQYLSADLHLPVIDKAKMYQGVVSTLFYYSNWVVSHDLEANGIVAHTWSLSIEEQFYFIVVALLWLCAKRRNFIAIVHALSVLMVILSTVLCIKLYSGVEDFARCYYGTDTRMGEIMFGVWFAVLAETSLLFRKWILPFAAYFGSLWLVLMFGIVLAPINYFDIWIYRGGFSAFAALTLLEIITLQEGAGAISTPILSQELFVWLGRISYTAYLWHIYVLKIIAPLVVSQQDLFLYFCTYASVTLCIAHLSYQFIERPILRYKDMLAVDKLTNLGTHL